MSTVEDFKNAPVGATATYLDGSRAMKMGDGEWGRAGRLARFYYDDEEMVHWGYTLDPFEPCPASAREALDLAWELAHPVKPGQVVPKGIRYLTFFTSGLREYTAQYDFKPNLGRASKFRTVEPLPEPETDWLDAPAVLATCGCRGIELWHPHNEKAGMWVSVSGEQVLWSSLRDVTPLYPKGQEA